MPNPSDHLNAMTKALWLILSACYAAMAIGQEKASEKAAPVNLVGGTTKPNNAKPASIFYTNDGYGTSSYAIDAAIVSRQIEIEQLGVPGLLSTSANFAAGISKDTVAKNPSDSRALTASLLGLWGQELRLRTIAAFALEDDQQNDKRSHSWRLNAELDARWLKIFDARLKIFPSAGIYRRRVTSTNDTSKFPEGHHGGPYVSMHVIATLGYMTPGASWYERVGVDVALFRVRDSSVSGGYTEETYDYATGTISYALHDYTENQKSVWKPSLAIVRNVGTDRLNNLPRKGVTKFGLQLSYGL